MFSSSHGNQITEPGFVIVPGEKGKGRSARADVRAPSTSQAAESPPRSGASMESPPCGLRLPLALPLWQEAGPQSTPVSKCGCLGPGVLSPALGTVGGASGAEREFPAGARTCLQGAGAQGAGDTFLVLSEPVYTHGWLLGSPRHWLTVRPQPNHLGSLSLGLFRYMVGKPALSHQLVGREMRSCL